MKKRNVLLVRNLAAQKFQFVALAVIITLGVAIFISLVVSFQNLGSSYQRTYRDLAFADFTVQVQEAPAGVVDAVRSQENVAAAEERLIVDTGLALNDTEQVQARLIGLPPDRRPAVNNILVQAGRYWGRDDKGVLLVESHFAQFHNLGAGDELTFRAPVGDAPLRVLGVAASPEYLINAAGRLDILPSPRRFGVFFMPLPQLQRLFAKEGRINEVSVAVVDPDDREATIAAVETLLQPYGIIQTVRQEDQPSNAALRLDLEGAKKFANLLPILVLAIAAMSIFIALGRMVQAQRQHIGLFMAIGYGRGYVLRHYLAYAVAIALVGSALGLAIGLSLAALLTDEYAKTMGIPVVQHQFQPWPIVESIAVSVLVAILAGIVPAWRSSRMQPSQAMRLDPQMALVRGSVPWVERAIRLVLTPPMHLRIALRAIFRTRMRSAYTVAGVSFSAVLLLAGAANFDTINFMLDMQYDKVERWDIDAGLRLTADTSLVQTVASWPEVRVVEPTLEGFGTVSFGGRSAEVVVLAMPRDTTLHRFQFLGGVQAGLGTGAIVLTPFTSRVTGAKAGDNVTLSTPHGEQTLTVSGVSQEALGSGAYLGLEHAQEVLGAPGMYNGMLIAADSGNAAAIQARLYQLPGVERVVLKKHIVEDWSELMALFYALAGVLLLFAMVMAFAILFNTITVNVLERQRELATMRTLGESRGRVATMMVVENLIVGAAALVPGLLLGTAVAYYITQSFNSEFFTMQFYISPLSYGVVAIGLLVVLALSVVPAVRRVNRMNLAEVTKVLV